MNKIKITCSQPVKWSGTKKPQKVLTYTHKESDHNNPLTTVTGYCAYLVATMKYHGLKKFTIEVLDE